MSSRLGRVKQLLELEGRPLLQHVVDAAVLAGLDEIVIVLGHQAERIRGALTIPDNARIVINSDYLSGQSSSLRVGLDALDRRAHAVVILLGDQPRLSSDAIRHAISAFKDASAPILRTTWQGSPGHPVIVGRSEWNALRSPVGDRGARDYITEGTHTKTLEMHEPPVVDVDTWEQYRSTRDA